MGINNTKKSLWKHDIARSVAFYNQWFMEFAPGAYAEAREGVQDKIKWVFRDTDNFRGLSGDVLKEHPDILGVLRMATVPPLAKDRLVGLSGVPKNLLDRMEGGAFPCRMSDEAIDLYVSKILNLIQRLLDPAIFPWIASKEEPSELECFRAVSVIADRLCGAVADALIRNEQERRQLEKIKAYLEARGYSFMPSGDIKDFRHIPCGHYSFHLNVPVTLNEAKTVNIPVDVAIMRKSQTAHPLPVLIECKSAGDFTNTNKRRKEEMAKNSQLEATYGAGIEFVLFLCGYFDDGYLAYEAAEGIDWIWEHRLEDFDQLGLL